MGEHRVVIVGGGFAGLNAAIGLRRAPVGVTVIDRRNFHLFQPLLYQVATGGLSPGDVSSPLRAVLKRQSNTEVVQANVVAVDVERRRVLLDDGQRDYDTLIFCPGVENHHFDRDDWAAHAPGLKSIEDAIRIRRKILGAFERAEREPVADRRQALTTFVVVGGGPTGVELAGAIGELARFTLRGEFRHLRPESARVLLVELGPRLLAGFPASLSLAAARSLNRLGVEVRVESAVREIDADGVELRSGGRSERIAAGTVLWAAGVRPGRIVADLAERAGLEPDRGGCLAVEPDLSLPDHPEILVIGDVARVVRESGEPVPAVAPAAMQMGSHAARVIRERLAGREVRPFRYRNRGNLAVIGRAAAVAHLGRLRFHGYPAWLLWLFVHILYLVEYENRLLVAIQWAFSYFTRNRGARLITEPE